MLILFPVLSASESEFLRQLADGLTAHGWKGTDFGQLPEKIVLPKSTISPGLVLPLAFYKDGRTILMAPSETDKAAVVLFTSLPSSPEGLWEGLMASVPGAISESGSGRGDAMSIAAVHGLELKATIQGYHAFLLERGAVQVDVPELGAFEYLGESGWIFQTTDSHRAASVYSYNEKEFVIGASENAGVTYIEVLKLPLPSQFPPGYGGHDQK